MVSWPGVRITGPPVRKSGACEALSLAALVVLVVRKPEADG
jgi:hypothetical protein